MEDDVRLIAFYLPQFHPIPENDRWWGAGFTEWRNTSRAQPNFEGHYQPHVPSELGYYDLRVPATRAAQAALANAHGIAAFCYYHYWFSGKRLLQRPLDEMVAAGVPDFPFCVCWANENWTRRWDGRDDEILIAQQYLDDDAAHFIAELLPVLADARYVRIKDRPLLLVYCANAIPQPRRWSEIWRGEARRAGHPDLFLASVQSVHQPPADPRPLGYDAGVEFPPHWTRSNVVTSAISGRRAGFRGEILDYVSCAQDMLARPRPAYPLFRGIMPGWDNTPRGQDRSHCFVNAEPANYERWLRALIGATRAAQRGDERLIFINAWNEWAEGCHLEPDLRYGRAFVEATARALMPAATPVHARR
ncbi:MAG: glycoside hydrolase family 99-like domain-containing protein [Burkholderiales bacterium]|jgi:lipopolysaccharide biosynthesis protein